MDEVLDCLFEIHLFEKVDCLVSVEGKLLHQEGDLLLADFTLPASRHAY